MWRDKDFSRYSHICFTAYGNMAKHPTLKFYLLLFYEGHWIWVTHSWRTGPLLPLITLCASSQKL